jgi:hypothetical protein
MEEGVDNIKIDENYKNFEGFTINEANKHDSNQLLRYLLRYQVNVKDCKFYIKKYRRDEKISTCIPETRFMYNTELLVLLPKKYFPKVNGIDECISTAGTNIIYRDHFIIAFEFLNPFTNEKKIISYYFCPFNLVYDQTTREIFIGLTACSFAKHKQGVTKIDKEQFKIVFHEKEQFKELYKINLEQLTEDIEKRNKVILYATNDSIVTLPFMNMYERFRQVIASRRILSEFESKLDDNQLYNIRFKNICNNEPLPLWHYKDEFILDLDYCRTCLQYSEKR